uniref:Uncharacterized protein n=1 Tax=Anguilla anguilla TaxID=7936 RepID=A0A0E9Q138_ANGAN
MKTLDYALIYQRIMDILKYVKVLFFMHNSIFSILYLLV